MFLNWVNIFMITAASQLGLSYARSYVIHVHDAESGAKVPGLSTLVLGYDKNGRKGSITISPEEQGLFIPDLNDPAMITSTAVYGDVAYCSITELDWNAGEQDLKTGNFVLSAKAKCTYHAPLQHLGYSAATGTPEGTPNGTPVMPRRSSMVVSKNSRPTLSSSMESAQTASLGQ